MPITPQIESRYNLEKEAIQKGNLCVEEKAMFLELLDSSKNACNGLTAEEKLQAISENAFTVNCILARMCSQMKDLGKKTWADVVIKVLDSWKVVAIVAILAILLGFHPEIRDVLNGFIK